MQSRAPLAAKVVVVTGGGSGIGSGICDAFAPAGNVVIVADLRHDAAVRVADTIVAAGGRARASEVDVTDPVSVDRLVDSTVDIDRLSRLHRYAPAPEQPCRRRVHHRGHATHAVQAGSARARG